MTPRERDRVELWLAEKRYSLEKWAKNYEVTSLGEAEQKGATIYELFLAENGSSLTLWSCRHKIPVPGTAGLEKITVYELFLKEMKEMMDAEELEEQEEYPRLLPDTSSIDTPEDDKNDKRNNQLELGGLS